jgi:hypothetical protein
MAVTHAPQQMNAVTETQPEPLAGRTELGTISIADGAG